MLGNYLQQTTSADVIFQMHFFLTLEGLVVTIHVQSCLSLACILTLTSHAWIQRVGGSGGRGLTPSPWKTTKIKGSLAVLVRIQAAKSAFNVGPLSALQRKAI